MAKPLRPPSPATGTLTPKEAESLGRLFNLAFNNSFTYAIDHPATVKGCADFAAALIPAFTRLSLVTVLLDREALYLEESRIDTKMNAHRLMTALGKSGVQSISFEKGITGAEMQGLVDILREYQKYPSLDAMKAELARRRIAHIRLNYVTIRKVTDDESVIEKSKVAAVSGSATAPPPQAVSLPSMPAPPSLPAFLPQTEENRALREMADLLSMTNLIKDPASAAQSMVSAAISGDDAGRDAALAQLRALNRRVSGEGMQQNLSADELIEAVCKLKKDLHEGIQAQKDLGRIARDEGAIISEVDRLTFEVVVRLTREEFRRGGVSVKRLAMLIRRLLPDVKELRRLLPALKQGLLAEGMALPDFLDLVKELRLELQSDGLAVALEQGAQELGLTVDEITKTIRDNPGEAARLLVLAAEIRNGARQDQKALSQLLTDYVEQISTHMVTRAASVAAPESAAVMGKMISDLEQQLLSRLKAHGVADGLMQMIEQGLSQRLSQTITRAKTDWVTALVASKPDLTGVDLVHLLGSLAQTETDLRAVHDPLRAALSQKGYTEEKIQEIYEKAAAKVKIHNTLTPQELPKGVLNVNNTIYFLKREISMHLRYHTVFSALVITVAAIKSAGAWRPPTADEANALLSQVFGAVVKLLRDLDFVGSMGSLTRSIPFIILPMTDGVGADVVKKRIEEKIRAGHFALGTTTVKILPAISATTFDKSSASDLKSFIEVVKKHHAAEEKEKRKGMISSTVE